MSNFVLLNNVAHKNLKVIRDHSEKYGDSEMFAITFPEEFRAIQAEYPIFFHKDTTTGKFYSAAIFGLREKENLFLNEKGWDATYIPVSVKRRPFLIGIQPSQGAGGEESMMVYIDVNSPRLSETQGEPIFLEHGGYSKYLENVVSMLDYIQYGTKTNEAFVEALLEYDLLETVSLEVQLKDGSAHKLIGFYTINEEKLNSLDEKVVISLHTKGYLEYIYMVLASLSNIHQLILRIEKKVHE